jgi:hypothetical protein
MAHLEEDRRIELPRVFGMEIYNMHQDLAEGSELMVATDILVSHRAFPDRVFRAHFDRPTENLRKWDEALKKKKLFGIAGNDAHQNTGVLARMTDAKEFEFFRTNGDIVVSHRPNWLTRPILRLLFGPLDPGRTLFHFEGGPYVTSLRHVKTHVLAEELTEAAVLEALREGRAFIGFDAVADSTGFVYLAESGERRVVVGESMPWSPGTRLRVASPHACRFTIVRDGETAHRAAGTELDWAADRPGKYRVEAELDVRGEWTPWVYTNPIELTPPDR